MSMMSNVAKNLGVSIDEEFIIMNDCYEVGKATITKQGLKFEPGVTGGEGNALMNLLVGKYTIKKLPFVPKSREEYWYVRWGWVDYKPAEPGATSDIWEDHSIDYCMLKTGNCFRTKEEAEKAKYAVYKSLMGKEWDE